MKRLFQMALSIVIFNFIVACQKDLPEPEAFNNKALEVFSSIATLSEPDSFQVRYFIKGKDVYVECFIKNFSFRDNNEASTNGGTLQVYVNGEKKESVNSAAFIIKNLATGTHQIELKIVKNNGETLDLNKELIITIP